MIRLIAGTAASLFIWSGIAAAQNKATPEPAGISSEWDVRTTLTTLAKNSEQILPLLDSYKVDDWIAKGATPAYKQQLESARIQVQSMPVVVGKLEKNVEKLSATLDVYFRLQSIDDVLGSLQEGVTKYQNPALAELLQGFLNQSSNARRQLRQYLVDLAALKEQEYAVMDKEAQRCRGQLIGQKPSASKKK